jgi:hypothetical protein
MERAKYMRKLVHGGIKGLKAEVVTGETMAGTVRSLASRPSVLLQDNIARPKSEACGAFLDFWASLRAPTRIPVLDRFCAEAAATYGPSIYIAELTDHAAIMRFQGAELVKRWNRDATGLNIYATFPHYYQARGLSNIRNVVTRPCGYLGRNLLVLETGGSVASDFIQLPLTCAAGALAYVVHYSITVPIDDLVAAASKDFHTQDCAWLDLGAGIPAEPPFVVKVMRAARGRREDTSP